MVTTPPGPPLLDSHSRLSNLAAQSGEPASVRPVRGRPARDDFTEHRKDFLCTLRSRRTRNFVGSFGSYCQGDAKSGWESAWRGVLGGAGRASFGLVAHRNSAAAVPLHHDDDGLAWHAKPRKQWPSATDGDGVFRRASLLSPFQVPST